MIATGIALSRWEAMLPAVPLFWFGTIIRTRVEDQLLRDAFGTEFASYEREVPALFPTLHRWRTSVTMTPDG